MGAPPSGMAGAAFCGGDEEGGTTGGGGPPLLGEGADLRLLFVMVGGGVVDGF